MKELTIVFTKSNKRFSIGSFLIRLWTGQDYSHVARKVIRRDWGASYYQASEGKVNYEHESIFNKKHEIVRSYTLMIDEQLEMNIREECWKECGNKYGMMQNVGIAIVDLLGCFSINIDTPWKKGRNCSELLYLKVFVPLLGNLGYNPDTIKPQEIEYIIHKHFSVDDTGAYRLKN